jgi:hypothetical protein
MAALPDWTAVKEIVCSGCEKVLYRPREIPDFAYIELDQLDGDSNRIRTVLKVVDWHDRKDCKNPDGFGVTITYIEDET